MRYDDNITKYAGYDYVTIILVSYSHRVFDHRVFIILLLSSEGDFCDKVTHSLRYVHSCIELPIVIKTSRNNPSQKSVVLESSAKPVRQPRLWQAWFGRRFKNH